MSLLSNPPAGLDTELLKRLEHDMLDDLDEELELEIEDRAEVPAQDADAARTERKRYFRELFRLQGELVPSSNACWCAPASAW